MSSSYTKMMNNSIDYFYDDNAETSGMKFLTNPNTFRPFSEGLTNLLERSGYSGSLEDIDEKSNYLYDKLQTAGSKTGKKTVKSWFEGTRRPKVQHDSRQKIYEICFALKLSIPDVKWMFNHVYFDRCFNFHNIEEAVYYFCLKQHLPYVKAKEMIEKIENETEKSQNEESAIDELENEEINYTKFVQAQVESFKTEEEVIKFLELQKNNFEEWNHSAYKEIKKYYKKIMEEADEEQEKNRAKTSEEIVVDLKDEIAKKMKGNGNKNIISTPDIDQCGLLIQELVWDAKRFKGGDTVCDYLSEALKGNVFSSIFFLNQMWINPTKSFKKGSIPSIVSNNFPSIKVLSNVLDDEKIERSESYDSIRKVLILLQFYCFWCERKLERDTSEYMMDEIDNLYETYIDEANTSLTDVGYEELYPGNPYDWIFLYSAKKDAPLEFFREMMGLIMENEN